LDPALPLLPLIITTEVDTTAAVEVVARLVPESKKFVAVVEEWIDEEVDDDNDDCKLLVPLAVPMMEFVRTDIVLLGTRLLRTDAGSVTELYSVLSVV